MDMRIEKNWQNVLAPEFEKPYFNTLWRDVSEAYDSKDVYPSQAEIFAAFNLCPLPTVRVVILGQDPYHGEGEAHGLAFSVKGGVAVPPSLRNILTEIGRDLGTKASVTADLTSWAQQGVLLLNSTLTVEKDKPGSHQTLGWEQFTDNVIETISQTQMSVVFLLWGAAAKQKRVLVDETKHLVLTAAHPSPLSAYRGFVGCRHFSQSTVFLEENGHSPITW